jgi:putative DNA primase/helicase
LKLVLVTNYRPRVHAEDTGGWRRLKAVPFTHKLAADQQHTQVREYLKTDRDAQSAVLAMIVSGAGDWYEQAKDGRKIHIPECMQARTEEWRQDADRVGGWIEDCCELDPRSSTRSRSSGRSTSGGRHTSPRVTGYPLLMGRPV